MSFAWLILCNQLKVQNLYSYSICNLNISINDVPQNKHNRRVESGNKETEY